MWKNVDPSFHIERNFWLRCQAHPSATQRDGILTICSQTWHKSTDPIKLARCFGRSANWLSSHWPLLSGFWLKKTNFAFTAIIEDSSFIAIYPSFKHSLGLFQLGTQKCSSAQHTKEKTLLSSALYAHRRDDPHDPLDTATRRIYTGNRQLVHRYEGL